MDITTTHGRLGSEASAFLSGPHRLLIGGEWVEARSGKTFDVFDPATGQMVAKVAEGDAADIDAAVAAARRAFEEGPWPRMSPSERGKLLWRLADVLEARKQEFAEIESLDNGKPIRDALAADLPGSYEIMRNMAGWATKLNGETIAINAPGDRHAYTLREPVGVVGQIIPWNFPPMMARGSWRRRWPAVARSC